MIHKDRVLHAVCDYFDVQPELIKSRCKQQHVVKARMFITYILLNADQLSGAYTVTEIARYLNRVRQNGKPDHSVTIYYHDELDSQVMLYDHIRFDLIQLLNTLNLSMRILNTKKRA